MKKNKSSLWVIIAILAAAGFAIPLMSRLYGVLPAAVVLLIILLTVVMLIVVYHKRKNAPVTDEKEELGSDIRSIKILTGKRNFIIKTGERFSFDGGCDGVLSYVDEGIWNIVSKNYEELPANAPEVVITVPEDFTFVNAEIDAENGNMIAQSLSASEMKIKAGSGNVEFRNIYAQNISAECGKGMVTLYASISNDADFNCGSGTLNVNMRNAFDDFNIDAFASMGKISIAHRTFGNGGQRSGHIENGAFHKMTVKCGMGETNITFRQVNVND